MNEADVMNQLKKCGGIFEIYHKTSFWGYRRNANGEKQKVLVDILDMGPEADDLRYSCVATTYDGKMATGNHASSIEVAISIVRWDELDKQS